MKTKIAGLALVAAALTAGSPNATAQNVPSKISSAGLNDITIISVDIGHFEYGHRLVHVFENSRNQLQNRDKPPIWQFNLEPILTTMLSDDGCVEYRSTPLAPREQRVGRKTIAVPRNRVLVPINLVSDAANERAIAIIKKIYAKQADQIGPANIDVLPITKVVFSAPDIEERTGMFYESVRIANKTQYFLSSPKKLFLMFDIAEPDPRNRTRNLSRFIRFMPFLNLNASITFNVKGATYEIAGISREELKDTEMMAKLVGYGSLVYVTRQDMREISQRSTSQLRTTLIVENPNSFIDTLINKMINASYEARLISPNSTRTCERRPTTRET